MATANCISQTNASVAFVDISDETLTIDPNKLELFVKKNKSKVKAVVGVDYAGHPCDWKSLKYFCSANKKEKVKPETNNVPRNKILTMLP